MILAGDEIGNSQGGNNNAYCQDNPTGWLDWARADTDFLAFCRALVAFRKAHPILRQKRFLHSEARLHDGKEDLFWWHRAGRPMAQHDWDDTSLQMLCAELRMASGTPEYAEREEALFLVFNASERASSVHLPPSPGTHQWVKRMDSAEAWIGVKPLNKLMRVPGVSVCACVLEARNG
jgi:glycogen operon protein